jgi:hypothetical protein
MDERVLKLTREQRAAIREHRNPKITGTFPCPVEKGHVEWITPELGFRVERVHWKGKAWSLQVVILDKRDPSRFMRRTPPALRLKKADKPATAEEIKRAAEESAYAHFVTFDEAPVVPKHEQARISKEARDRDGQLRRLRDAERQRQTLSQRVQAVRREAELLGVDLTRQEARLRGSDEVSRLREAVAAMERKLRSKAA